MHAHLIKTGIYILICFFRKGGTPRPLHQNDAYGHIYFNLWWVNVRGCSKYIVHCGSFSQVWRQACGASAMMCRVNSYNEEKLDFTTRLLPHPCARLLANEDRLLLSSTSTTSYPSRSRWTDMQQWIRHCRSSSSNIIVRLLEEAKSQAQTERCSCEHWSTHIARLLHETKLLCEPTIVLVRTTTC